MGLVTVSSSAVYKLPKVGTCLLDSRKSENFPRSWDGSEGEFSLDLLMIQDGWTSIQALPRTSVSAHSHSD